MDGRALWKDSRRASTATWTCRRTPGAQRRWCRYHLFVVAEMEDVGRALVTSPSPSAQAQMTGLRGDHDGWRWTPAAETDGRRIRACRSTCGKTRPSTPQRSRRVCVAARRAICREWPSEWHHGAAPRPGGYGKHCVGSCTRSSPCFLSLATRSRWVASFLVTCGVNCERIVFDIQRSDTLLSRSRTISLFEAGAEHDSHTLLFYVGVHKVTRDLVDARCCP
jgi:hypothetical protein